MSESLVKKARAKARKLNISDKIYKSDRVGKKLMIITPEGKKIHFGSDVSQTYLEGASEQKRDAYRARASKIKNKAGEYTYKIKYTSNYLAFNILW